MVTYIKVGFTTYSPNPTTEVETAPTMFPNMVTKPKPIAFRPEGRILVVDE